MVKLGFSPFQMQKGEFYKTNGIYFLKSYMGNHISGSFGQSAALYGALFTDFALKSD